MKIFVRMAQLAALANAFQVQPHGMKSMTTCLQMGFFDFKPVHGSGTGSSENELEEQYRLQQEIVRIFLLHFHS